MRPIIVLAGLAVAGLFFSAAPARADMGCACVKLGASPVCMPSVASCVSNGGLCAFICQYDEPKKKMGMRKSKKKKG